ncbi:hypothetical protein FGIG_07323 [Fasciola gigantica]|uniref:Uncharacterized protein n=1 Tax=Fasciola gigantica TaxID=46835 RepID=A0A504YHZ4_FASGI|nr:hypothetical protein FGIG_07323 [Fasciola gigantica]
MLNVPHFDYTSRCARFTADRDSVCLRVQPLPISCQLLSCEIRNRHRTLPPCPSRRVPPDFRSPSISPAAPMWLSLFRTTLARRAAIPSEPSHLQPHASPLDCITNLRLAFSHALWSRSVSPFAIFFSPHTDLRLRSNGFNIHC